MSDIYANGTDNESVPRTVCPECERLRAQLTKAERDAERWRKASDAALLIYDRNARKIVQDFIAIWSRWGATDSADVLRTPDDPLSPNYDPTYADQPSAGTCDHFHGQTVCEWRKGTGAVDAPTSADDPSCPKCDGEGHG